MIMSPQKKAEQQIKKMSEWKAALDELAKKEEERKKQSAIRDWAAIRTVEKRLNTSKMEVKILEKKGVIPVDHKLRGQLGHMLYKREGSKAANDVKAIKAYDAEITKLIKEMNKN